VKKMTCVGLDPFKLGRHCFLLLSGVFNQLWLQQLADSAEQQTARPKRPAGSTPYSLTGCVPPCGGRGQLSKRRRKRPVRTRMNALR
jgi:hypothetical protein